MLTNTELGFFYVACAFLCLFQINSFSAHGIILRRICLSQWPCQRNTEHCRATCLSMRGVSVTHRVISVLPWIGEQRPLWWSGDTDKGKAQSRMSGQKSNFKAREYQTGMVWGGPRQGIWLGWQGVFGKTDSNWLGLKAPLSPMKRKRNTGSHYRNSG